MLLIYRIRSSIESKVDVVSEIIFNIILLVHLTTRRKLIAIIIISINGSIIRLSYKWFTNRHTHRLQLLFQWYDINNITTNVCCTVQGDILFTTNWRLYYFRVQRYWVNLIFFFQTLYILNRLIILFTIYLFFFF